mgnify:FL=1
MFINYIILHVSLQEPVISEKEKQRKKVDRLSPRRKRLMEKNERKMAGKQTGIQLSLQ